MLPALPILAAVTVIALLAIGAWAILQVRLQTLLRHRGPVRRVAVPLLLSGLLLPTVGWASPAPLPLRWRSSAVVSGEVQISSGRASREAADLGENRTSGFRLFLQVDPSGYADSPNLYAGFGNDPVNNRDPTGRVAHVAAGAAVGAIVFAGIEGWRQVASGRFDGRRLLSFAVGGAVVGGGAAATFGGSLAAGAAVSLSDVAAGITISLAGGSAQRAIAGEANDGMAIASDILNGILLPVTGGSGRTPAQLETEVIAKGEAAIARGVSETPILVATTPKAPAVAYQGVAPGPSGSRVRELSVLRSELEEVAQQARYQVPRPNTVNTMMTPEGTLFSSPAFPPRRAPPLSNWTAQLYDSAVGSGPRGVNHRGCGEAFNIDAAVLQGARLEGTISQSCVVRAPGYTGAGLPHGTAIPGCRSCGPAMSTVGIEDLIR